MALEEAVPMEPVIIHIVPLAETAVVDGGDHKDERFRIVDLPQFLRRIYRLVPSLYDELI